MTGGMKLLAMIDVLVGGDFDAAKYGALSNESGTVKLDWQITSETSRPRLRMIWAESWAAGCRARAAWLWFTADRAKRRRSARGEATVDFLPMGVVYTISCELEQVPSGE